MISKHLSGHIYRNSPYESDDSCGTCDGARCDSCSEYWTVPGFDEDFYSKDEAEEKYKMLKRFLGLDPDDKKYILNIGFFIKDDSKLYALIDYETETKCIREVDPEWYDNLLKNAKIQREKYNECKCTDKDDEYFTCSKVGCNDNSCYRQMLGGKTEHKIYL